MNRKNIRLIALDMDGTLLNSKKKVDPQTITAINEAVMKGITVVYCSGRGIVELDEYQDALSAMRYGVCLSGALVYDFKEERPIYENNIDKAYIPAIIRVAEEFDAMCHILLTHESIVEHSCISHMEDYHMGIYTEMFRRVARQVENMETEAKNHPSIPKINIYFRSIEDKNAGFERLKDLPLSFASPEITSVEMNANHVSKATGLRNLADHLHISMDEVMAIGDGDNDRQVLKSAGLSVAMANAGEKIKSLCDVITDDNDHDGVGKAIRKYCF